MCATRRPRKYTKPFFNYTLLYYTEEILVDKLISETAPTTASKHLFQCNIISLLQKGFTCGHNNI